MVPDDLSHEEHERLDRDELLILTIDAFNSLHAINQPTLMAARAILTLVVTKCGLLDKRYSISSEKDSKDDVTQLFERHPWLVSLVQECCVTRTARKLRLLKILRKPAVTPPQDDTEEEKRMVLESWDLQYQGNATHVLLDIISDYLRTDRNNYAPLASIINSSGTGKSRMIDELAKTIISVPMCLRDAGSKGFPPADDDLRSWLVPRQTDREETERRLHGFLHSLLEVTLQRLKEMESSQGVVEMLEVAGKTWTVDDMLAGKYKASEQSECQNVVAFFIRRQERLASTFRELMTHGQAFGSANDYRRKFFKDVISGANKFAAESERVQTQRGRARGRASQSSPVRYRVSSDGDIRQAGNRLNEFIYPTKVLGRQSTDRTAPRRPILILAFDESHGLTESAMDDEWSVFSELRRALRQAAHVPIFSLFLATGGKFRRFSPELSLDPSNRISGQEFSVLPPITETGFDVLAYVAYEGVITLSRVTDLDWMCHLGRPLFGSLFDSANADTPPDHIQNLAKHKILGGRFTVAQIMRQQLGGLPTIGDCVLASVAIRFALEFNPTTAWQRHSVLKLVERHMRLCISATSGFEALSTTSSSEPILAEAALEILSETHESPVRHLAGRLDVPFIDRGNRGELAALLILMAARDKAARMKGTRDISLCEFLEALMPASAYAQLKDALPVLCCTKAENKPLLKAFKKSRVWFNHVIKIHDFKMLSSHELWKFMTRGAMILCATNQVAVDIVIPFCYSGNVLSRKTVSAILIQVKNADSYGQNPRDSLFHNMNPFAGGIQMYKAGETPLPFIRMVFALASQESAVKIIEPTRGSDRFVDPFTPYDIWFAGMAPETFPVVGNEQNEYKVILQRSLPNANAAYSSSDPGASQQVNDARENIRRNSAPLCEPKAAHNTKYVTLEEIAAQ
ncbi:hypothetical protein BC834DRAFT_490945 [Gloeopeniophorella convolvens]|nr:hypothetical protein BC834DRAFT_490945 [Gloeopeniophorella convolvens]